MAGSTLQERLKHAIGDRPLSQVAAATGASEETVRRYLRGDRVSPYFLSHFAQSYGVSAEWLLAGSGPPLERDAHIERARSADLRDIVSVLHERVRTLTAQVDLLERRIDSMRQRNREHPVAEVTSEPARAPE